MTTRPSNDAIAQAFWEREENDCDATNERAAIYERAREIDAKSCATPDNREVSGLANSEWVMVPKEPTSEMQCAGFECDAWDALCDAVMEKGGWPYSCRESAACVTAIYKAMAAAAPTPPKAEPVAQRNRLNTSKQWGYTDGNFDMREVHDHGGEYQWLYTEQPAATCNVEGTWLWCKLMDWCSTKKLAPANYDGLFAIAAEAHKLNSEKPTPDVIRDAERYRFLRDHHTQQEPDFDGSSLTNLSMCRTGFSSLDEAIDAAIREQRGEKDNG